jgi:hypothetical protein
MPGSILEKSLEICLHASQYQDIFVELDPAGVGCEVLYLVQLQVA